MAWWRLATSTRPMRALLIIDLGSAEPRHVLHRAARSGRRFAAVPSGPRLRAQALWYMRKMGQSSVGCGVSGAILAGGRARRVGGAGKASLAGGPPRIIGRPLAP